MGRLLESGPRLRGLGILFALPLLLAPAPQERPTAEAYRGRLCFTTVVTDLDAGVGRLLGSEEPGQQMFATGDNLFAEAPAGTLEAGDGLLAYRIGSDVEHPVTDEPLGTSVFLAAYLTVMQVQGDRALVHVEFACAELERGDLLRPLHDDDIAAPGEAPPLQPAQLIQPDPADATLVFGSGETVQADERESTRSLPSDRVSYTVGDVLTLDMGTSAAWTPGAWGTVYAEPGMARRYAKSELLVAPVIVAQGYVLWATPDTAAFMVTEAVGGIEIGMRVRRH